MWSIEIRRYMTENRSVGGSIPTLGTTSLSIRSPLAVSLSRLAPAARVRGCRLRTVTPPA
jgi:hypothetical protein